MPGKGKFIITGKLGDVMQESAQAAMSYVRSRALNLGLAVDFHQKIDLHVHFPGRGAPEGRPVGRDHDGHQHRQRADADPGAPRRSHDRRDHAPGAGVLPIGGLKEKMLAAYRGGATKIIIPQENHKDLRDIPRTVRRGGGGGLGGSYGPGAAARAGSRRSGRVHGAAGPPAAAARRAAAARCERAARGAASGRGAPRGVGSAPGGGAPRATACTNFSLDVHRAASSSFPLPLRKGAAERRLGADHRGGNTRSRPQKLSWSVSPG